MTNIRKLALVFILFVLLTGCRAEKESISVQRETIKVLESEISNLEMEKSVLLSDLQDLKVENGEAKYVVTLNISQSHYSLNVGKHMKNALNDIKIQVPVDKEFFDAVQEGDLLDNSLRIGSVLLEGSWGKWKVKVAKKEIL